MEAGTSHGIVSHLQDSLSLLLGPMEPAARGADPVALR